MADTLREEAWSNERFRAPFALSRAEDREVRTPVVPFPGFGESKNVPNFEIGNGRNLLAKLELLEKAGILEEVASPMSTCPDSESAEQICQSAAADLLEHHKMEIG